MFVSNHPAVCVNTLPQNPKSITKPATTFKRSLSQDAFVKRAELKDSNVSFNGLFNDPVKKVFKANPDINVIYQNIVDGNAESIKNLEGKLGELVSAGKISKDIIAPFARKLIDDCIESCAKRPTDEKASVLVKLNAVNRVVIQRLNAFCSLENSYSELFNSRKQKKARAELKDTERILNTMLALKDIEIRNQARSQMKEALLSALMPNTHSAAKVNAMTLLTHLSMVDSKSDVQHYIREIKSPNNRTHVRINAVNEVTDALNQYIVKNKEQLNNDDITNIAVDVIKALQYIQIQEDLSSQLKLASNNAVKRVVTDKDIPKEVRESLVKALYGLKS